MFRAISTFFAFFTRSITIADGALDIVEDLVMTGKEHSAAFRASSVAELKARLAEETAASAIRVKTAEAQAEAVN